MNHEKVRDLGSDLTKNQLTIIIEDLTRNLIKKVISLDIIQLIIQFIIYRILISEFRGIQYLMDKYSYNNIHFDMYMECRSIVKISIADSHLH